MSWLKQAKALPPALGTHRGFKGPRVSDSRFGTLSEQQWNRIREDHEALARMEYARQFTLAEVKTDVMSMPYFCFVPELEEEQTYPLVVFLHGGGERGAGDIMPLISNDGACLWVRKQQKENGQRCFVLVPQAPDSSAGFQENELRCVIAAIDTLRAKYPIDDKRVYLTGLSMGGGGCWRLGYMLETKIAAIVSCSSAACSNEDRSVNMDAIQQAASALHKIPLWLFHAEDDASVPVELSVAMKEELERCGGVEGETFFFTKIPAAQQVGHASWKCAHSSHEVYEWLFQQRRGR